jgi:hypothetical protein
MGVVTKYGFFRSAAAVANPHLSNNGLACLQGERIHALVGFIYFDARERARNSTSSIDMRLVCQAK